jgi:hypothetical protein
MNTTERSPEAVVNYAYGNACDREKSETEEGRLECGYGGTSSSGSVINEPGNVNL